MAYSDNQYLTTNSQGHKHGLPVRCSLFHLRHCIVSAGIGVLLMLPIRQAFALPPALTKAVPDDVVAALFVSGPDPAAQLPVASELPPARNSLPAGVSRNARSTLQLAAFLADQAQHVGVLSLVDAHCRAWIDGLAVMSIAFKHPHAAVLLDIRATARADGGHQLAGLHAALIIHTRGDNGQIEGRIQHLLNTYTNREESIMTTRSNGGQAFFTLRDRRLPPWAVLAWGQLGDHYVVAIGDKTFERIARAIGDHSPSLAADAWFHRAGHRFEHPAAVALYVRFDHLRRNMDASLVVKTAQVKAALGLVGAQRGLWTAGYDGRAVVATNTLRRAGRDEFIPIAGPELLERRPVLMDQLSRLWNRLSDSSGDEATLEEGLFHAVIDCDPSAVLHSVCEAYAAAKSPRAIQGSRAFWRGFEDDAEVSIERDVFSRLGGPIIIHNYPRHALRLPFAWTILMPITGDAAILRSHVDRLLGSVRRQLSEGGFLRLHHDGDGVWYLQYGLSGPGLIVTDRWLVVSFSPQAVRANVALLRSPTAGGD